MNKPIFQASFLGNRTEIYPHQIVYQTLGGLLTKITIPIEQVSSVNLRAVWVPGVIVETSGGQRYGFYLPYHQKELFRQTVLRLLAEKNKNPQIISVSPPTNS